MTEQESPYGLTDEQNAEAESAAVNVHAYLNKHVSSAVKKITDQLHEGVHNYVMDMMEIDTRYNFANMVRCRVNSILKGLLSGGYDEEIAKKWLEGYDFEDYRKKVYEAHRDIVQNKLIDDLTAENKRLKESLEFARRSY